MLLITLIVNGRFGVIVEVQNLENAKSRSNAKSRCSISLAESAGGLTGVTE